MLNSIPSKREGSFSYEVATLPKYLGAAAVVAVVAAALARILTTPGNFHDGDLSYPITAAAHLQEHYPVWNPIGLGNEPLSARLFFHLPFVLIAEAFGLDGGGYVKLLIAAAVFGSGLAAYVAARILAQLFIPSGASKHPWATTAGAAVCGLLYSLNPWSLGQLEHLHILAGLAPAPLLFVLLLRGLIRRHLRSIALAALAAAIIGSVTPHSVLLTLFLVAAATLFHVAVGFAPDSFSARLRAAVSTSAIFAVVYVLGSAFGWLPILFNILADGTPPPAYLIVEQDLRLLAVNQTWINTVRLVGNWQWSPNLRPAAGTSPEWSVISLIPLAALFSGSVFIRSLWRPMVFLLALGAGAAAVVSASASPPFDGVWRDAVVNLPLGWLIREPDRGSWFLVLAYSLGLGLVTTYFLVVIEEKYGRGVKFFRSATTVAFALVASILIGYAAPAVRGVLWDGQTALRPLREPQAYLTAESKLNALSTRDAGRILVIASNQERFWSSGRRVDSFLARSLKQRSVSNITELGRTFSSLIEEVVLTGGNPQELLLDAGITLVAVEADHPHGQSLRFGFNDLSYPLLVRGDFLSVFHVPAGIDPSVPSPPSPTLEVSGGLRIVAGMPVLEPGASDVPAVSADYVQLPSSTVRALAPLRIGLGSRGSRDLSVASGKGVQLIPLVDATLNSDPAQGWARARATDLTYSRWRSTLTAFRLKNWQLDHGTGLLFTIASGTIRAPLPQDLVPGSYRAWIRTFSSPSGGRLRVAVVGGSVNAGGERVNSPEPVLVTDIETIAVTSAFEWREIGELAISEAGSPEVVLEAAFGLNAVSSIAIAPLPDQTSDFGFGGTEESSRPEISWRRASSTRYVARIAGAENPFFVVLHEHFNPKWIARVNGLQIEPVLTSGISNGYVIPAIGEGTVTIEYGDQMAYDLGIVISGFTGLAAMFYVLIKRPQRLAMESWRLARVSSTKGAAWLRQPFSVQIQDRRHLIPRAPYISRMLLGLTVRRLAAGVHLAPSLTRRAATRAIAAVANGANRAYSRIAGFAVAAPASAMSGIYGLSIAVANAFWIKAPLEAGRIHSLVIRIATAMGRLAIVAAVILLPTAAIFVISGSTDFANTLVSIAAISVVGAIGLIAIGRHDDAAEESLGEDLD